MPSSSAPSRRRRIPALALALALGLSAIAGSPALDGRGVMPAAAADACGSDTYVHGIDVSKYQGTIDWPAVAASGIEFGIARIADGLTFPDATFQRNYAGMRANGITPGSYLFFEPAQDPVAQGNAVVAALTTAGFQIGDLPPAIDVEVTGGRSPAAVAASVRTAATTIQAALGVTPLIYTSPGVWNRIVASSAFGDLPLWIAHWMVACPRQPAGWSEWSLWQYTSSGFVPGITGAVDLNQTATRSLPVYTGVPVFPGLVDVTTYALGPTAVTYAARAAGPGGAPIGASCSPASGSVFPLGTSAVTCAATNAHGAATRRFSLTVQLAAEPAFDASFPADVTTVATGPDGTLVSYGPVTAVDYARARLPATCTPASGTLFAAGRTSVTCRATDSFGRSVQRSFGVSVGYQLIGLFPPVTDPATPASPASVFAVGDTVPVRFALAHADGSPIPDTTADALAAACAAAAWLVPVDDADQPADGSMTADHSVLACARHDAAAAQLVADVPTAGALPGDYTVLVTVTDSAGSPLATHVAEITLR